MVSSWQSQGALPLRLVQPETGKQPTLQAGRLNGHGVVLFGAGACTYLALQAPEDKLFVQAASRGVTLAAVVHGESNDRFT